MENLMKRKLRTLAALLTRLFFRAPLVLLANISFGLSQLFDSIGEGLNHSQKLLKPLSDAPIMSDLRNQIDDLDEKSRRRVLKELLADMDT